MKNSFYFALLFCSFSFAKNEPMDFDFRTRGFKIDMDSRIAVDGKRICWKYARIPSPNTCEALRNCQSDALSMFEWQLKNIPADDKTYRTEVLINKALILAFKEATLFDSLAVFDEAYEFTKKYDKEKSLEILAMKGVVQLRLGELKNCISNHNAESCILPLSKMAQHVDKKGSEEALKIFYQYLKEKPNDDHVKWLVNVLHMTLGTYPKEVPKKYFISLKKLESEKPFPKFENIAQNVGITEPLNFGGAAVADMNQDGYLDMVFGSLNQCDHVRYYQFNPKSNSYDNKSFESGLTSQLGGGLILPADYDNDGDLDFLITRGAWHPGGRDFPAQGGFVFNSLMENDGKGKFTDVTEKKGLKTTANSTLSANWGDINNDGLLDLFISNESRESEVFLNRGNHFENFTQKSGVINKAIGKGTSLADLNNDGNLDIVIANYAAPNRIYMGNGDGTFHVPKQHYLPYPDYGFPTAVFDYNNDGYLDIFIAAFAPDIDNFAKWLQNKPSKGEPHRMYKNMKDGTFKDVSDEVKLKRISLGMSVNYGDIDNNGFKDLYVGTGANSLGDLEPNHLYANTDGKFYDVTFDSRTGSLQKGHGIVFADLNDDGHKDLVLEQGGSSHADRFFPAVFMNPQFKENSFIELKLQGVKSNRQGMHSRVTVKVLDEKKKPKTIFSWIGSTGSFGSNPPETIIGLGKISKLESVKIEWHGSKTVQEFKNLVPGQKYKIIENSDKPETISYRHLKLGKAAEGHHHHQ